MQKEGEEEDTSYSYETYLNNYRQRMALREINFNHAGAADQRPKIAQIKFIQKFIGRLKSDNKNHEAILTEMQGLNLSKYLEEISSLLATCVSEKQIRFFSQIATRLNQEYEDFPTMLLKDLQKQFMNTYNSQEDNKPRLKALLLFTTDLFVCGFSFPYKEISQMLKKLVKVGTRKRSSFTTEKELRLFAYYYNCDIYAAFLMHYGMIFTHATPKWIEKWSIQNAEITKYPLMIPAKTREDYTNIFFSNYIISCISVLDQAFNRLKELEDQLRQNLRMSGQFTKSVALNYNEVKQKFLYTKNHLELIIQSINSSVILKDYEKQLVQVECIMKKYINKIENVEIFQNEFERELYLELPDVCKSQNKAATDDQYKQFKDKLDNCKNRAESDEIAKAFETVNNKKTRRMLAKDLLEYRKEYQLVTPFLCRIAAVIGANFRDISETLTELVFVQFQKLRENINTSFVVNDKKSRNLKYICELTKFKLIDSERAIAVIQNLIDDLKGYNIELLISMLQSIGRFLYLSPNHANKFTFMLSKLENVMKQKSFPLFTTSQLLNSINLLKPHIEIPKEPKPELTSVQIKAEVIFSQDIIQDIDPIIKDVHQLSSKNQGMAAVKEQLLRRIEEYDFLNNYNYAFLVNQLHIQEITLFVVDKTIEKLEEAVKAESYQNCMLWARFFGELYKYELIKRNFLYEKLQSFLAMRPNDIAVLNLVCTVLETCSGYLTSKRVSTLNQQFLFLVSFKEYIHSCLYVPMLQQFKIIDVFEEIQPNLTSIKPAVLESFIKQVGGKKMAKQFNYSAALDDYLEKRNLKESKEDKESAKVEQKDPRIEAKPEPEVIEEKNNEMLLSEAKMFDSEFLNVMNSHIKDLSGRIAKPAFVQKVYEKKRQKKKIVQGEKKLTIIGRCGNKFVKKDVLLQSQQRQITRSDLQ